MMNEKKDSYSYHADIWKLFHPKIVSKLVISEHAPKASFDNVADFAKAVFIFGVQKDRIGIPLFLKKGNINSQYYLFTDFGLILICQFATLEIEGLD